MSILEDLKRRHKFIAEAYEVAATYEFRLQGMGAPPFKVNILRDHEGLFVPSMSHHIQASGAAGPHRPSLDFYHSIEDALHQALMHGLMSYDPKDEGATWEVNEFF